MATNDTAYKVSSTISIYVTSLQMILNTLNYEYSPGDTLSFNYEIIGSGASVSSYYKIIGDFGEEDKTLVNMPIDSASNNGTIKYDVPKIGNAESYEIVIYAIDSNGHYVEKRLTVNVKEYEIYVEFNKENYKPGDAVTFSYKIIALTDKKLEGPFRIIYDVGGVQSGIYESLSPYGNITFNLTKNITEGDYIFLFEVYIGSNDYDYVLMGIKIKGKEEKSVFEKYRDVGAALGFPLAIICLLLVFLFLRQKESEDLQRELPPGQQLQQPYLQQQYKQTPQQHQKQQKRRVQMCPKCGKKMEYTKEYNDYYCWECEEYLGEM